MGLPDSFLRSIFPCVWKRIPSQMEVGPQVYFFISGLLMLPQHQSSAENNFSASSTFIVIFFYFPRPFFRQYKISAQPSIWATYLNQRWQWWCSHSEMSRASKLPGCSGFSQCGLALDVAWHDGTMTTWDMLQQLLRPVYACIESLYYY